MSSYKKEYYISPKPILEREKDLRDKIFRRLKNKTKKKEVNNNEKGRRVCNWDKWYYEYRKRRDLAIELKKLGYVTMFNLFRKKHVSMDDIGEEFRDGFSIYNLPALCLPVVEELKRL
jgi:hypothetical protein